MPEYVARLDAARLAAARDDAIRREAFRQGLVRRVNEWPEPRPLWCSHASTILARMSDRGRAAAEAEQDARDLAVYLAALDAPDDGQAQSAADGVYRASSLGRQQWELRRARLLPTERAMGIFGSQAFAEELQSLRASAADTGQLDAVAAIESEFRSAVRRRKIDNAVALMRLLTPNETRRVVISNAAKAMSELEELAPAPEEMKIGIKLLAAARATVLDRVRWLQAEERAIGLVDNARLPAVFDAARLERASQAAEAIRALVRSHGAEVVSTLPEGGLEELEAKIATAMQAAGEQRSKRDRLLAELAAGDAADAGPDARRRADAAADELQRLSDGGGLRLAPLDGAALARVFERTSGRGTFALRVTPTWRQDRLKTVWNPAALSESNRLFELCQLWISVALPQPGGTKIPVNAWVSVADKASPAATTFGPYPIALTQQG
ncbi:MAG: hypothetical protein K2Q20_12185, partial [Phycisphaerales bacterium]|nr:hypothetical protein [Phycisphaerales bacterium]